jgi:hypothetical protein
MMEAEANPVKAIFRRLEKLENLTRSALDQEGHSLVERVLERRRKRLGTTDNAELRARVSATHGHGSQTVSDILRRRPWA